MRLRTNSLSILAAAVFCAAFAGEAWAYKPTVDLINIKQMIKTSEGCLHELYIKLAGIEGVSVINRADLNYNGEFDQGDVDAFGVCMTEGGPENLSMGCTRADLNGDGLISLQDLVEFARLRNENVAETPGDVPLCDARVGRKTDRIMNVRLTPGSDISKLKRLQRLIATSEKSLHKLHVKKARLLGIRWRNKADLNYNGLTKDDQEDVTIFSVCYRVGPNLSLRYGCNRVDYKRDGKLTLADLTMFAKFRGQDVSLTAE